MTQDEYMSLSQFIIKNLEVNIMENIRKQLESAGYDYAVAIATKAEIEAGAACGQLSLLVEGQRH